MTSLRCSAPGGTGGTGGPYTRVPYRLDHHERALGMRPAFLVSGARACRTQPRTQHLVLLFNVIEFLDFHLPLVHCPQVWMCSRALCRSLLSLSLVVAVASDLTTKRGTLTLSLLIRRSEKRLTRLVTF